jgi:hypothetical protein
MAESDQNWRDILWREWRNSEDEEYARYLFRLLIKGPISWKTTLFIIVLGTFCGLAGGLLVGSISTFRAVQFGTIPQEKDWSTTLIIFVGLGGLIGSGIGLVARLLLRHYFRWSELFFISGVGIIFGLAFWVLSDLLAGAIVGLLASLGGKALMDWRGLDRSDFFNPLTAGLTIGFIIGPVSGAVIGLVLGGIGGMIGGLLFALFSLPILVIVIMFFGLSKKIAKAFESLHEVASKYKGPSTHLFEHLLPYSHRSWYFWWQDLPGMIEVEMALREACATLPEARKPWAKVLRRLEEQKRQLDSVDKLIVGLRSDYWIARFTARYGLVVLGGQVVAPLQIIAQTKTDSLSESATKLIRNIAIETTARIAEQVAVLLCPYCLARCHAHQVHLIWQPDLSFYGCRVCSQSREFLEGINHVVAVLDAVWPEAQCQQNGALRVNWLQRRSLFDFDQIEIIQASDEEVEHFAVQVGNDTDPFRKSHYRQMQYTIAPECPLSENTRRILASTFGRVERGQASE